MPQSAAHRAEVSLEPQRADESSRHAPRLFVEVAPLQPDAALFRAQVNVLVDPIIVIDVRAAEQQFRKTLRLGISLAQLQLGIKIAFRFFDEEAHGPICCELEVF